MWSRPDLDDRRHRGAAFNGWVPIAVLLDARSRYPLTDHLSGSHTTQDDRVGKGKCALK
jgi:hypothetical protein